MLKNLWLEYWWILPTLLYIILAWLVATRASARTKKKFVLAVNYMIILTLPFMHRPWSFGIAASVVFNLLIQELVTSNSDLPDWLFGRFRSRTPSHRRQP